MTTTTRQRRPRRARPSPRLVRRVLAVVAVVALVAVGGVLVSMGSGFSRALVDLGDGSAWLTTTAGGLHVNGASGQPDAGLRRACPSGPDACSWVQQGVRLYSFDGKAGTARKVDVAALTIGPDVAVSGPGSSMVLGDTSTFAYDPELGVVHELDPETLAEVHRVTVGEPIDDAVVDGDGRLWVAGGRTGKVTAVHDGRTETSVAVVDPGTKMSLGSDSGSVYVVDQAQATVSSVSVSGLGRSVRIQGVDAASLLPVRRSDDTSAWVLASSNGALFRMDLKSGSATQVGVVSVGEHNERPMVLGDTFFVQDTGTGRVNVFNTASGKQEPPINGVSSLIRKESFVYASGPNGAGIVIDARGVRRTIRTSATIAQGGDPVGGANGTGSGSGPNADPNTPGNGTSGKPGTKAAPAKPKPTPKATPKPPAKPKPKPKTPAAKPGAKGPAAPKPIVTTVPGKVATPLAVAGDGQAVITWTPPAGSPKSYVVVGSNGGTFPTSDTNPDCSSVEHRCVVSGLTNGDTYTFTVTAVNSKGAGPRSDPSNPVTPSATPLRAPTDVTAELVATNGSVKVSWVDDQPDIAGFTVVPNNGSEDLTASSVTAGGAQRSAVVSGLDPGQKYRFKVVVRGSGNRTAASGYSDFVTVVSVPGALGAVTVVAPNDGIGATSASLSWAAVPDNGAAVTYRITNASGTTVATVSDTSWVADVQPGDETTYTVTPVNSVGAGGSAKATVVSYIDLSNGPQTGPVLIAQNALTATKQGGTYSFSYAVKNTGAAAWIPQMGVSITPAGGGADQVLTVPGIFLKRGETYTFSSSLALAAGDYSCQVHWYDAGSVPRDYDGGPTAPVTLTVP